MTLPLNSNTFSLLAAECRRLCRLSGHEILRHSGDKQIRSKGKRDWVTAVDEDIQHLIETQLADTFPGSAILGEEVVDSPILEQIPSSEFDLIRFSEKLGHVPESPAQVVWIIDPIDGTNNFIHGFPYYAVSIAATINGVVVAGAVEDVCRGKTYWASAGGGAFCDDQKIMSSDCQDLSQAMVVGSIPRLFEKYPACHQIFQTVSDQCQSVRRLGSAALNMALLADGKLDAYWALSLQIWDIAAGAIILNQAGGSQAISPDPHSGGLQYLGAGSPSLASQMSKIIEDTNCDIES